jgi:hypothetical protein
MDFFSTPINVPESEEERVFAEASDGARMPMFEGVSLFRRPLYRMPVVNSGTANIYYESFLARGKTTSTVTDSVAKNSF